jgi:hypothetical protein
MGEQNIENNNEIEIKEEKTETAPPPPVKIVGVRFKRAGRIYYFDL